MFCAPAPDGRVFITDRSTEEFKILCYFPNGEYLYDISLPYEPIRKSDEQIQIEIDASRQRCIEAGVNPEEYDFEPEEYIVAIRNMQVDGQNRLWVRGGQKDEYVFKVFTLDGEFLYNCYVELPDWQECDQWAIRVNENGFLANPLNPECYTLVYILEETVMEEENVTQDD